MQKKKSAISHRTLFSYYEKHYFYRDTVNSNRVYVLTNYLSIVTILYPFPWTLMMRIGELSPKYLRK